MHLSSIFERSTRPRVGLAASAVVVAMLAASCAAVQPQPTPPSETDESVEREMRFRFARADLVDVATFVSDRTGVGFVIATPELRTRTLSLYVPKDVDADVLDEMFRAALESQNIVAEDRGGYHLIREVGSEAAGIGMMPSSDGALVTIDFREASVTEVARFLALLADVSVIVASDCPQMPITVYAPGPIETMSAVEMIVRAIETEGGHVARGGDQWVVSGGSKSPSLPFGADSGSDADEAPEDAQ